MIYVNLSISLKLLKNINFFQTKYSLLNEKASTNALALILFSSLHKVTNIECIFEQILSYVMLYIYVHRSLFVSSFLTQ